MAGALDVLITLMVGVAGAGAETAVGAAAFGTVVVEVLRTVMPPVGVPLPAAVGTGGNVLGTVVVEVLITLTPDVAASSPGAVRSTATQPRLSAVCCPLWL